MQPNTQRPGQTLRDRMNRLARHAAASGITPDPEPADGPDWWAKLLEATPAGMITLNSPRGPVTLGVGSLSPGQICSIQAQQLEYGDAIEWHLDLGDGPIKSGRPGPFSLAHTHRDTGRLTTTTWDRAGRITATGHADRR